MGSGHARTCDSHHPCALRHNALCGNGMPYWNPEKRRRDSEPEVSVPHLHGAGRRLGPHPPFSHTTGRSVRSPVVVCWQNLLCGSEVGSVRGVPRRCQDLRETFTPKSTDPPPRHASHALTLGAPCVAHPQSRGREPQLVSYLRNLLSVFSDAACSSWLPSFLWPSWQLFSAVF